MANCLTLKKSNCKNCYKCIRHCPVKAIRFSGNQAHIIGNECILCGRCFVVCPQDAKEIVDGTEKARVLLQSGDPVIVSLAPSFIANYEGVGIESMRRALKKLGFYDVEETAIGATIVKTEYERMLREEERDIVISSCCHSVNLLIQKYFPSSLEYLADVMSPMQAHCADIKKRMSEAKTVFIGPCIAKRKEATYHDNVDYVMTFEELGSIFDGFNIDMKQIEPMTMPFTSVKEAHGFAQDGGVTQAVKVFLDKANLPALKVANLNKKNIAMLKVYAKTGKCPAPFIEVMACEGGCASGPCIRTDKVTSQKRMTAELNKR
jgi:iron only hydrogenase large subunit-like protein